MSPINLKEYYLQITAPPFLLSLLYIQQKLLTPNPAEKEGKVYTGEMNYSIVHIFCSKTLELTVTMKKFSQKQTLNTSL